MALDRLDAQPIAPRKLTAELAARAEQLTPERMRLLLVMANPENLGRSQAAMARAAKVNPRTLWLAMRTPEFCDLLDAVRVHLFGYNRSALALRIVQDALKPLHQVKPAYLAAHTKAREMAAALMGLVVTQPALPVTSSPRELPAAPAPPARGMLAGYPPDVLDELARTNVWPERAGPAPWDPPAPPPGRGAPRPEQPPGGPPIDTSPSGGQPPEPESAGDS